MTMDERTDKMLRHFSDKKPLRFFDACEIVFPGEENAKEFGAIHDALMRYMRDTHDLIYTSNNLLFMLTARGIDILDVHGGWLTYWATMNAEKTELDRLRDEEAKFQKRYIKLNTWIQVGMLACAIFGGVGLVYGFYQANKNTTLEQQLEIVSKEKSQLSKERGDLDSLSKTKDKEIQELTSRTDSLVKALQAEKLKSKTKKIIEI